jgi:CMP-N-acetylneuraminic acid synthetase
MAKVLGLIPARGGSKSIPRKNIAPLLGRPLLAYTCEAALSSTRLTRVVLSTDDEEIARVGRDCGVEAPFIRPRKLAGNDASSLAVAQHAVRWMSDHENFAADLIVLLQPTSPLRLATHIDEALDLLERTGADTVVSVSEVPHRFNPFSIMKLNDDSLLSFWQESVIFDRFQRQNIPRFYARNGPAVLAARTKLLFQAESFYGERIVPYVMNPEESVDIDSPFDLEFAAWILQRRTLGCST